MGTQMKEAMKDAGLKPKRQRGVLRAAVDHLKQSNCSQMHPCTVSGIASAVGYTETQVSQALSSAYTEKRVNGLRRTTSGGTGYRFDYWIEVNASAAPKDLAEAMQLAVRAHAMITEGGELLSIANAALEQFAKAGALTDDPRALVQRLKELL